MVTRRTVLRLTAGAVTAFAPLLLPAAAQAAPSPALPSVTTATITVDEIMALYRRMFVLRTPAHDDDNGTTTWANNDATFTLNRVRDEVVIQGAGGA